MNEAQWKTLFSTLSYTVPICFSAAGVLIAWIWKHYKEKRVSERELRNDSPEIKKLEVQQNKIMRDLSELAQAQERDRNSFTSKIIETKADIMNFMEITFNLLSHKNKN